MGGTGIYRPLLWAINSFLKEKPQPKIEVKRGMMGPVRDKFMQIKAKVIGKPDGDEEMKDET
jgi:hypothetical protein